MKVLVSATGKSVDSPVSPVFGRAEYYSLVDTDDLTLESFENPARNQSGGAGIQAAQFVLEKNPESVISSNIGPNAFEVLSAGSVPCYSASGGTVRENIEAFNSGKLTLIGAATAESHSGMAGNLAGSSTGGEAEVSELEILTEKLRDLRSQVADILRTLDEIGEENR